MLAVIWYGRPGICSGWTQGYSLLLQSVPSMAGTSRRGNGVHKVQIGDQVKLWQYPATGYRFLYWIGDVGEVALRRHLFVWIVQNWWWLLFESRTI
jgi:hypothetical protein